MANHLVVPDIDDEIVLALTKRAAMNGRTVEQEHLEILRGTLLRPKRRPLAEVLASMPNIGVDADIERSL